MVYTDSLDLDVDLLHNCQCSGPYGVLRKPCPGHDGREWMKKLILTNPLVLRAIVLHMC